LAGVNDKKKVLLYEMQPTRHIIPAKARDKRRLRSRWAVGFIRPAADRFLSSLFGVPAPLLFCICFEEELSVVFLNNQFLNLDNLAKSQKMPVIISKQSELSSYVLPDCHLDCRERSLSPSLKIPHIRSEW